MIREIAGDKDMVTVKSREIWNVNQNLIQLENILGKYWREQSGCCDFKKKTGKRDFTGRNYRKVRSNR